jgi:hypothetical protein
LYTLKVSEDLFFGGIFMTLREKIKKRKISLSSGFIIFAKYNGTAALFPGGYWQNIGNVRNKISEAKQC